MAHVFKRISVYTVRPSVTVRGLLAENSDVLQGKLNKLSLLLSQRRLNVIRVRGSSSAEDLSKHTCTSSLDYIFTHAHLQYKRQRRKAIN